MDKLKIADEIKHLFKQKLIDESGNVTASKKGLSLIVLELYNAVNKQYHCGHTIFKDKDYRLACKRLESALKAYKVIEYLKNLPKAQNYDTIKIRTELINWILRHYQENITQIEKSLEYHYKKAARPDGSYNWNDGIFKNWLQQKFCGADSKDTVNTRITTADEALSFFQDLLVNEKLHLDYYVFYHAAQPISVGLYYFNNVIARLINASGATAHAKVYNYNDEITTWLKSKSNTPLVKDHTDNQGTIKNVNAIIQYMNSTGSNDYAGDVAKHLASTSYSLFALDPNGKIDVSGVPSALLFFKECATKNPKPVEEAFDVTWEVLTKQAIAKNKYKNMINAKFTEKLIRPVA